MREADTFLHGFSVGLEAANGSPAWNGIGEDDDSCDDTYAEAAFDEATEPDRPQIAPATLPSAAFTSSPNPEMSTALPGRLFDPSSWD
jgi:hypothetical protein